MNILQFLNRVKKIFKQLLCNHGHTFTYFLDNAMWESNGKRMGKHNTLCLKGCYECGFIKVVDYGA
jgi:hypothetical protein